jgi:hypothetical protein
MDIFANHIVDRISLTNPGTTAFFIYSIILAAIFLSISKAPKKQEFLNFSQTEQLRGIAILLIILGHLKTNVLARNDYLSFYFGLAGSPCFFSFPAMASCIHTRQKTQRFPILSNEESTGSLYPTGSPPFCFSSWIITCSQKHIL